MLTAETQGMIGHQLNTFLECELPGKDITALLTSVEVEESVLPILRPSEHSQNSATLLFTAEEEVSQSSSPKTAKCTGFLP